MNIVEVCSEAYPFAKTGGLADVLGALPEALSKAGHNVKLFIPFYKTIKDKNLKLKKIDKQFSIKIYDEKYSFTILSQKHKRLPLEYYFIKNDKFYDRDELYTDSKTGKDYEDNYLRFILLNKAVLETIKYLNWRPDIFHVHDWQAGLIPAYLKHEYSDEKLFEKSKSVLTIHNLAYQGTFKGDLFKYLDLPENLFYAAAPFEFYEKVNFLKGAISFADKITTVSPNYAKEIQTKEYGCGLDGVLSERRDDLTGILNGVDYKVWSPSRDKKIPYNYYQANLSGKLMNKIEILNEAGLPHREKVPLVSIISRLADQKGFDLIAEAADEIFSMNIQMILLGTGEKKYHDLFLQLEKKYPDKLKAYLTFDDTLAHKIEAASDMFLMPSRFEPCGLNQMYSLKYGTVPIVRKVGGLADSVINHDSENGTGFVFEEYTSEAMIEAFKKAVSAYQIRRVWVKIMKNGMKQDFSWKKSADKYLNVFNH